MADQNRGVNPLQDAMTPQETPKAYFGILHVSGKYVALERGKGKVDYIEGRHKPRQRCTMVSMSLSTFATRQTPQYTITRDMLADPANVADLAWVEVTLPSLNKIKMAAADLDGTYVQAFMVETGETYDKEQFNERGVSEGWKTVKKTGFRIVALFPNEASCRAAEQVYYGDEVEEVLAEGVTQAHNGGTPARSSAIGASPLASSDERKVAANMLATLWMASGHKKDAFLALVAGDATMSKHFTATSSEVLNVIDGKPVHTLRTEDVPEPPKANGTPRNVPTAATTPRRGRNVPVDVTEEDLPF
jgi:hypothetical protein